MIDDEYLTTDEVCDLLSVSHHVLKRLRAEEGLPFVRLGRQTLRYSRRAVLAWVEAQTEGAGR